MAIMQRMALCSCQREMWCLMWAQTWAAFLAWQPASWARKAKFGPLSRCQTYVDGGGVCMI